MRFHLSQQPNLYHSADDSEDLEITCKHLTRIVAARDDGYRREWLHNITANYTVVFLQLTRAVKTN
jgi:hypothetical protein